MKIIWKERIMKAVLWASSIITMAILILILFYILGRGIKMINFNFIIESPREMGTEGGIFPAIIGTIYLTLTTVAVAAPIGVAAGIYLAEYACESPWVKVIRFGTNVLSAIPSILFGLFGYALFVVILKPITGGWSIISGALTGAIMILPLIIRSSEETIKALPKEYKEGSLALGATRWQTTIDILLPASMPGIVTGIILGIGRIIGETAALLLTLGGSVLLPHSIFDPARTLAMHIYLVAMEVGAMDVAFGAASVLIITILVLNFTTRIIIKRYTKFF